METMLTATYSGSYKKVIVNFMQDGSCDFASMGEVSDDDLVTLAEAGGGNVAGWHCELS